MKIFLIAISTRIIIYVLIKNIFGNPEFISFDSWEYFYNSQNLEVWENAKDYVGYELWYERTPAYVLFLYLIRPENAIFVQTIISALGVVLMHNMNRTAGWIWCFYPVSIFNSFQYMKETFYIFLIIWSIYALRKHYYSTSQS